ncbi:MAG: hypothetical protein ACOX3G_12730 [Armatimonadota bacterium]|jgi:hypothetical protein
MNIGPSILGISAGEILLPAWLLLSLFLQTVLKRSGFVRLVRNTSIGISAYIILWLGLFLSSRGGDGLATTAGAALLITGHAVLFGWAVSPDGCRFLYAPLGILSRYWPSSLIMSGAASEKQVLWDRSSWIVAGVVVALDIAIILSIRMIPI